MIIQSKNFNIQQIADSGQCFRMNKIGNNKYSLVAYNKYIELAQVDRELVEISCSSQDYDEIWKEYFDLDFDYGIIVDRLLRGPDEFLRKAVQFGDGLRILKQEPFETLISFIISQNKNIPAIKRSIEKICERYGEQKEWNGIYYYTFPTPEQLADAREEELRSTGLGYRDEYVIKAARAALKGDLNLGALKDCCYKEAITQCKGLRGVGDKVASCIALYGLHHLDAVPVDVWISRTIEKIYNYNFDWEVYNGYAGIVQQYMFYYIRNIRNGSLMKDGGEDEIHRKA
ncbi:MAG: DNA glycosylase [Eubacteriales bacterium]|nr:DNA glycosylase [Eubacteriales bacterium]MDD4583613.1 DNA glycosylase [Eubacteriales bacterium]